MVLPGLGVREITMALSITLSVTVCLPPACLPGRQKSAGTLVESEGMLQITQERQLW